MEKYEEILLDELTPYENNARTHSDAQVDKIVRSISEFGFINPVLIDKNNMIIAGHGRCLAAKKMGLTKVPCLRVEHLTEAQVKAYVIADNKLAEEAGWDEELLKLELQSLQDLDFDISLTGFTMDDFVTVEEVETPAAEVTEVEFNADIPEVTVKRGDIYQLGEHRLMCGDSTDINDVQLLLDDTEVDLVVTDPPYGVDYTGNDDMKIANDNLNDSEFVGFLQAAFYNIKRALKAGGAFYIWYASSRTQQFYDAMAAAELQIREELIWVKNALILGRSDYQWRHEPCLYGWKEGASHYFGDSRKETTVIDDFPLGYKQKSKEELCDWIKEFFDKRDEGTTILRCDKPTSNDLHPTMKPIKLMAMLIKNSSKERERVLDLFGGSGSTMMACEQLNRICYTMEYDEKYAQAIINRWESFTGEKAVLLNGNHESN